MLQEQRGALREAGQGRGARHVREGVGDRGEDRQGEAPEDCREVRILGSIKSLGKRIAKSGKR